MKGFFRIFFSLSILLVGIQPVNAMTAEEVVDCTNQVRSRHGVPPLVHQQILDQSAHAKLEDMEEYGYLAHNNPYTQSKPWDFVALQGYAYAVAGENLAFGYDSAPEVCDAWTKSPTHLRNMLRPEYKDLGVSNDFVSLQGKRGELVVQHFGVAKESPERGIGEFKVQKSDFKVHLSQENGVFVLEVQLVYYAEIPPQSLILAHLTRKTEGVSELLSEVVLLPDQNATTYMGIIEIPDVGNGFDFSQFELGFHLKTPQQTFVSSPLAFEPQMNYSDFYVATLWGPSWLGKSLALLIAISMVGMIVVLMLRKLENSED